MKLEICLVGMVDGHEAVGILDFAQFQRQRLEIQILAPGIHDHKVIARTVHIPNLHRVFPPNFGFAVCKLSTVNSQLGRLFGRL